MKLQITILSLILFQGTLTLFANNPNIPNDANRIEWVRDKLIPCENTFVTTTNSTVICKDGDSDLITFDNTGNEALGINYVYIITNTSGSIQLSLNSSTFDFDFLPTGDFQVYGLSYDGTLNMNVGDNISAAATFGSICSTLSANYISFSIIQISEPGGSPVQDYCAIDQPEVSDLFAIGTDIKWYANNTSSAVLPLSTLLVDGEDYYATQTVGGCESANRQQVLVTIADPVPPTGQTNQDFCAIDSPTVADLTANGTTIQWYEEETSFSALANNVLLVDGEDYYASQIIAGCESDTRLLVIVNIEDPIAPTGATTQFFCSLDNPLIADLVTNGQNPQWYADISSNTPLDVNTALIDGEDYFSSQEVNGCESLSRLQIVVAIEDPDAPTGQENQIFCEIDEPTISDLVAIGEDIIWYSSISSTSPLGPGVPLIDGEDYFASQTVNGCQSDTRFPITVTIESPPQPTGDGIQTFCSIDNPIVINLLASGTNMVWYDSPTATTPLSPNANLVHGEAYHGAQILIGCISKDRIQVVVIINDPDAPTGDANQTFCSIDNPTIDDMIITGTDLIYYENVFTNTPLAAGTLLEDGEDYYVTQTLNGCESDTRLQIVVTVDDPLAPTGDPLQTFCAINNPTIADLSATGNNILWYADPTSSLPLDQNLALADGEDYFATQTVNACESGTRLGISVEIGNPLAPTGATVQEFCSTDNPSIADLTAMGDNIQWYEEDNSVTALDPNTLLIDGEDYFATQTVDGCESDSRLEIQANITTTPIPSLIISAQNDALCGTGSTSIDINNSELGVDYQLQSSPSGTNIGVPINGTGATISIPTGGISTTTTFEIVATNISNTNCQTSLSTLITITVDDASAISADAGTDQILCDESSTFFEGNSPTLGTGTWVQMSGPNTANILDANNPISALSGLIAGTYHFEWQVANGACSGTLAVTDAMEITVVQLSATPSPTILSSVGGNDGVIGLCIEGATNPVNITWSPTEGEVNVVASASCPNYYEISGLTSGLYDINIDDANACSIILSGIEIQEPDCSDFGIVDIATTDESCPSENNATISIEFENGIGEITYDIGNGITPVNTTNTSYTFEDLEAGDYDIIITDERGCSASPFTGTVTITEPDELAVVLAEANPSNVGGTDGTICITPSGGTAPYSISSSCGAIVSGAGNCGGDYHITNLPAGPCSINITDANGCTVSELALLSDPSCTGFGFIDVVAEDLLCNNDASGSIFISMQGGQSPYEYSIDGGNTFTSDNADSYVFNDLATGNYDVHVKDASGCLQEFNTTVQIQEPVALEVDIVNFDDVCEGMDNGNITTFASGGVEPYTYLWSNSSTGTELNDLVPGNYTLTVTDANGCTAVISQTLAEIPGFSLEIQIDGSATENRPILEGETVEMSAVTDAVNPTFLWTPPNGLSSTSDQTVSATPEETTIYLLTVTSENGCAISQTIQIDVNTKNIFLMPNTFSPNGDGLNDGFYPIVEGNVVVKEFKIFNRWGQLIHDNPSASWDGTYKGKSQALDTYVYMIQYQIENEEIQTASGDIVLMR